MRIISGTAKGMVLFSPPDTTVRPTSDRAKETLFNILMPKIIDAMVLDLFCGSGALGLEALSRGAKQAVFVDASKVSLELAQKNAEKTKLAEKSRWILGNLPEAIRRVPEIQYGLIFADPPYSKGLAESLLNCLAEANLLASSGWAIFEHDHTEILPDQAGKLEKFREKQIGKAKLTFYRICENSPSIEEVMACESQSVRGVLTP